MRSYIIQFWFFDNSRFKIDFSFYFFKFNQIFRYMKEKLSKDELRKLVHVSCLKIHLRFSRDILEFIKDQKGKNIVKYNNQNSTSNTIWPHCRLHEIWSNLEKIYRENDFVSALAFFLTLNWLIKLKLRWEKIVGIILMYVCELQRA